MSHSLLAEISYVADPDLKAFDTAILVLRVVAGMTIFAHGYNKFFGGGKIAGTARWFSSMGMRPNGMIHAWMAASTETGAGVLFAIGFLTPLAAAGLVSIMVVAGWTHRQNGFFIVKDGWEYNMILAVLLIAVAAMGPGRYSVDWAVQLDASFDHWVAFAIALGVGLIAPISLLAACYRPPAAD